MIAVVLIVVWLLGLVSAYVLGGYIRILLVLAIAVVLLHVISGKSSVTLLSATTRWAAISS